MIIFASVADLFSVILILIAGLYFSVIAGKNFLLNSSRVFVIYTWHSFFSFFYLLYVINFNGDAIGYFNAAKEPLYNFEFGTTFIVFITSFLTQILGLSLLGCFLVFNFFGVVGLLAFDGCLQAACKNKNIKRLATLIIFLPSVSFWSSAIGKDSISFMAVGLALWAALNLKRRLGLMTFAVVAMLLVRPHMAGMMVIALAVASLVDSRASLPKKAFMGILAAASAVVMVPFALKYAGVGDVVDVESVSSYIDTRQSHNMEGGGGIDIASMSLPEQFFSYMFRPLVFEINSVFSAAAALDNLILLFLFAAGGWAMLKGKRSDLGENRVFMWVYALMAWGILAMTTANLGIALRQKWMFAPMLIFLLISVIGRRKPLPSVAPHVGHAVHVSAVNASPRRRQL